MVALGVFISDTYLSSGMIVKYVKKSLVCILYVTFVLLNLVFKTNFFEVVYRAFILKESFLFITQKITAFFICLIVFLQEIVLQVVGQQLPISL